MPHHNFMGGCPLTENLKKGGTHLPSPCFHRLCTLLEMSVKTVIYTCNENISWQPKCKNIGYHKIIIFNLRTKRKTISHARTWCTRRLEWLVNDMTFNTCSTTPRSRISLSLIGPCRIFMHVCSCSTHWHCYFNQLKNLKILTFDLLMKTHRNLITGNHDAIRPFTSTLVLW